MGALRREGGVALLDGVDGITDRIARVARHQDLVAHVVGKDQKLFFYYEVYDPGIENGSTPQLRTSLAFYRGKVKAFETTPLEVKDGLDPRSKAVPVSMSVPLASLQPGRYTCQVNLLNPAEQKFAVWRSNVVLLP